MENHRFLLPEQARQVAAAHGTPCYVYDQATLEAQADAMLAVHNLSRLQELAQSLRQLLQA